MEWEHFMVWSKWFLCGSTRFANFAEWSWFVLWLNLGVSALQYFGLSSFARVNVHVVVVNDYAEGDEEEKERFWNDFHNA